jgi:hypothetical protein
VKISINSCSGGISLYYKSNLKDKISVVESHQCGIIWTKTCKTLFYFNNDVFICSTYIPPYTSNVIRHNDVNIFDSIELGIEKYRLLGKIFINGDLNSKTANERDFTIYDRFLDSNYD